MNSEENNIYHELLQQSEQKNLLYKEKNLEEKFLWVLTINYSDYECARGLTSNEVMSITKQYSIYIKQLSDDEINSNLTFISIEKGYTYEHFKDYILKKYTGKKRSRFQLMFNDKEKEAGIKNIFRAKVYEHKMDLTKLENQGFFSGKAHNEVMINDLLKNNRSFLHEAINRSIKYTELKEIFNEEQFEEFLEVVEDCILYKLTPQLLPNRNDNNKQIEDNNYFT